MGVLRRRGVAHTTVSSYGEAVKNNAQARSIPTVAQTKDTETAIASLERAYVFPSPIPRCPSTTSLEQSADYLYSPTCYECSSAVVPFHSDLHFSHEVKERCMTHSLDSCLRQRTRLFDAKSPICHNFYRIASYRIAVH